MTPRELAAAIRRGHGMIAERVTTFYNNGCGCALGAAMAGSGVTENQYIGLMWERTSRGNGSILASCELLGIPEDLAIAISCKHSGGQPRLAIADWLDTLEPETKPADKQTFDAFMATVTRDMALQRALPIGPVRVEA